MPKYVNKYRIYLDLSDNFETFKGKIFIEYSGNNGELILDAKNLTINSLNIDIINRVNFSMTEIGGKFALKILYQKAEQFS